MANGVYYLPGLCGTDRSNYAFWNDTLTLNTNTPDLTVCFQKTVLLWVPCGWLWAWSIFYYFYHLYQIPKRHSTWAFSYLNFVKVVLSCLLCFVTILGGSLVLASSNNQPVDYMYEIIRSLTMVLATVIMRLEYIKGIHSSGICCVFWLLQFTCDVFILHSWILRPKVNQSENQQFIVYIAYFSLVTVVFILSTLSDKGALTSGPCNEDNEGIPLIAIAKEDETDNKEDDLVDLNNERTSPELYVSFWQKFTFVWMTREVLKGYFKPVTCSSIYRLLLPNSCRHLVSRFLNIYYKDGNGAGKRPRGTSFSWSLFLAVRYIIIAGLLLYSLSDGLRLVQVMVFGELIKFMDNEDLYTWKGVFIVGCLFGIGVLTSLIYNWSCLCFTQSGMRAKSITCAAVYRKALRLSGAAKATTPDGEILNLMSVDSQKIQEFCVWGTLMLPFPLKVVVCTPLLWNIIGPASLSGILLLAIVILFNGFFSANWIKKLQTKQMEWKDIRLKLISEILSSIKIIKLYAWELPFLEKVVGARAKELHYLQLVNIIDAFSYTIWFLMPFLISAITFITYVLISPTNILTPYKVFVVLSLINVINQFAIMLPYSASITAQTLVSFTRISKFLQAEEIEDGMVERDFSMSDAVSLREATLSWVKNGPITLSNINLSVPRGQLVAVVGHVGAGKSSLLAAILGEMSKHHGSIKTNGSFAYVPQEAWIRNASVRDNVTFGKRYMAANFEVIVEATALLADLQMFPDGELTEIGEKGINLSGGQKQRVSLARAIYQDKDIYLLDDPLSAVDAHVGRHIFENVISNKGILRDKTRILVTHGIHLVPYVDVIVVMRNGVISEMGSFDELNTKLGSFTEFLHIHTSNTSQQSYDDKPGNTCSSEQSTRKRLSSAAENKTMRSTVLGSKPTKLIEDETAQVGNVRFAVIWRYIKAGGTKTFYLVLLSMFTFVLSQILTGIWLQIWSADEPIINGTMDSRQLHLRIGVYGALGVGQALCTGVLQAACAVGCVWASRNLHADLLHRLIKAPMALFDSTPLGRILNRCSADMDMVDSQMLNNLSRFLLAIGPALAILFLITYTTPIFILPCSGILTVFLILQHVYICYLRQMRRLASIHCSPIYSHFDETIQGAISIRAYGQPAEFILECERRIDHYQEAYFMICMGRRWMGVLSELLGNAVVFFAALFVTLSQDSLPRGMAALSVSYALNLTITTNFLIRMMTELETNMVSVERINEYCQVNQEADWDIPETKTENDWPRDGMIEIESYSTRYRPGLDPVLADLNCDIEAGQKVGIVGRTGAGKSSLALAMVRIIEATNGSIKIDGIPIATLGLHDLRSHLTIIPQDPVIFSGSLRYNLDPFSKHSEAELWQSLEKAHLRDYVETLPEGLDYECGRAGEALSTGQCQLLCLARAILRKTKVLILDEATAAVDLETDALIQTTIREVFSNSTVLAIAHRLATVINYDRIMVIDNGKVAEFDAPQNLLAKRESIFYSLAKEAGVV